MYRMVIDADITAECLARGADFKRAVSAINFGAMISGLLLEDGFQNTLIISNMREHDDRRFRTLCRSVLCSHQMTNLQCGKRRDDGSHQCPNEIWGNNSRLKIRTVVGCLNNYKKRADLEVRPGVSSSPAARKEREGGYFDQHIRDRHRRADRVPGG